MNLVTLIGRLTADPELKFFSSGTAISKGTIAIDRSYKKDNQTVTDFIPVEVWGKQAEYFATCFQKGYLIAVSGSLHIDRYVDSDGNNRNFAKIVVHKLMRLNIPKGNELDTGNSDGSSGNNSSDNSGGNAGDSGANTDAGTDTSSASDSNIDTSNDADVSGVDNGNSTLSNDPQANLTACIDDEEIPF
ncbi:MAG: single-stranded DNA-binding protein [Intestinibacter bartlettii]|uniref:single-stranded DNA-binding protein n=1 Tax=Intestinibacter bartlettii TaxID=261299 RepID=UPI002915C0B1|nr:single-stranded DNA-binding protein [Intestinibacter bartlettii]MDU6198534.1 single-stranded DNA-binding protein [Intestinibacter bartlettii]